MKGKILLIASLVLAIALSGCIGPVCGNGSCEANETQYNCPQDCGSQTCSDTDGGDNIYEKGTILGPLLVTGEKPVDYCLDYAPGTLVEYSCSKEGGFSESVVDGLYSKSVNCEIGCEDGACTKSECTEIGQHCPFDNPDYQCNQCQIINNKLTCAEICEYGCCADGLEWGRCMNPDGKCCPPLRTLTDCPAPT